MRRAAYFQSPLSQQKGFTLVEIAIVLGNVPKVSYWSVF